MKILKNSFAFIFFIVIAFSCVTDEDIMYSLDYIPAPTNVDAIFDITQDNTGLVTIVPNSEGATKYTINFGDGTSDELSLLESTSHIYPEGVHQVGIKAIGITGLATETTKELNVTFKAPENLVVSITKDAANPKIVSVSATATFATIIDIYFGDVEDEEATHILPGEVATHTYTEIGDYEVKVIAKSAGSATTEYTETITIEAASDPINLPIDFESFTVNYAFTDFGGVASSVVDNPDATGIDTSSKVGQSHKTAGAETWAGTILTLETPIDFSVKKSFKIKVWSPKAGAIVKLKVENLTDGNINMEVDASTTVANAWEELSFDFSTIDLNNEYQKIVLFFDFGNVGDDAIYYFDDIMLKFADAPSSSPVEDFEGEAPTFTDFGNAASEIVANPDVAGTNNTATVAKQTKANGAETWAGSFFEVSPLDLDNYSNIKVKVWSPKSGIVVKLKLENADASVTHEVDVTNTMSSTWEELTYDFSGASAADYVKIVLFFDFGNVGDGSEYYYDEIVLANEGGGSVPSFVFQDFEGEAPAFTDFGNAFADILANHDVSGINTSAKVVRIEKVYGAETWAGNFFEVGVLDLDTYNKISMKTWSPKSGILVKLKLENADASVVHEVDLNNTIANEWETLTYDFSSAPAGDFVRVVIFFDFGNAGDDSEYYFDEFELTN
jgi:hypothetical protein